MVFAIRHDVDIEHTSPTRVDVNHRRVKIILLTPSRPVVAKSITEDHHVFGDFREPVLHHQIVHTRLDSCDLSRIIETPARCI